MAPLSAGYYRRRQQAEETEVITLQLWESQRLTGGSICPLTIMTSAKEVCCACAPWAKFNRKLAIFPLGSTSLRSWAKIFLLWCQFHRYTPNSMDMSIRTRLTKTTQGPMDKFEKWTLLGEFQGLYVGICPKWPAITAKLMKLCCQSPEYGVKLEKKKEMRRFCHCCLKL